MRSRFLFAPLLVAVAAASAQAPKHPNFSGYWSAIMEEGNVIPPYLGEKIKIEHQEPKIQISSTVQEKPVTFRFAVDGNEHANTALFTKLTTTARWEGNALILTSKMIGKDNKELTAKERWTLAPNGRKLSMQGYFETGTLKKNQLLEYERQ
jgi:hypothetical protein